MNETFSFRNFIVCEDIRIETNGKQILIGTYAGAILAENLPVFWPTFAIRVEVTPLREQYELAQLKIDRPNGTVLSIFDLTNVKIHDIAYPAALVFRRSPMSFEIDGNYPVSLAMDSNPIDIGHFTVAIRKRAAPEPPQTPLQGRRRRASPR
jgi:hypothetical protein